MKIILCSNYQKEYIYELTFLGRNDLIKHMGNK